MFHLAWCAHVTQKAQVALPGPGITRASHDLGIFGLPSLFLLPQMHWWIVVYFVYMIEAYPVLPTILPHLARLNL
jgi:hypothetical protein